MQLVITDGYTLNPGDLQWDPFYSLGDVQYYDRTKPEEIAARCAEATVIITNKTPLNRQTIEAAPNLKIIAVTATGYNVVDVKAAHDRGIVVVNVPDYGTASVAQHTISLLLELSNRVGLHAESVAAGEWSRAVDWCYTKAPIVELQDKVIGLVGFGKIGQQVGVIAHALGMRVQYANPSPRTVEWATPVSMDVLFETSDVISLHCPLTVSNKEFINTALLSRAKSSAFLINTSRGPLIREADLADALRTGKIAAAAVDVLSTEPPAHDNPLLNLPNCIVTPHIAWLSKEARQRIMNITYKNVVNALAGKPQNVVKS